MTSEHEVEFTHEQGLKVGCVGALFAACLIYFGGDRWSGLGLIAFLAISSTVFIQRRLLRRTWFLAFIAIMILAHVGLVLALPWANLDRSGFRVLAFADVIGVIALSFGLEKLMSPKK